MRDTPAKPKSCSVIGMAPRRARTTLIVATIGRLHTQRPGLHGDSGEMFVCKPWRNQKRRKSRSPSRSQAQTALFAGAYRARVASAASDDRPVGSCLNVF